MTAPPQVPFVVKYQPADAPGVRIVSGSYDGTLVVLNPQTT
jgi:hypothetical protein